MRSLLSLLLVSLLIGLAACNPVDEDTTGDSSENQHGRKPAFDNGTATLDRPVKLGFNLELKGGAATFGISAKAGAELALDEINAAGGLLGQPVEAVFEDNQSMAQPSANVANKLISSDLVDVLIGAVGSSQSIAMAKVAEDKGVPMVTPASTNPTVTLNDDGSVRKYVFRTCFTDDFQGEGIVDFAVNGPIHAKKAVIFYDAENDYSVGIWETVKRVAPDFGLEIVAEDAFLKTSESDFRAKLNKFKAHEFDVLIVPAYYTEVGMIANQAREVGLEQPLLGGDGFDSPELYQVAGENIVGSYFTNHYAADDMDPAVQDFIRSYKERNGGKVPDAMAILTYDAVKVVAQAITTAGSVDHDAVAAALADTKNFKGAAGTITIDAKHNTTKKLVVLEIGEGGQQHWVYTYDPLAGETEAPAAEAEMTDEQAAGAETIDEAITGDETADETADETMEEAEPEAEAVEENGDGGSGAGDA
ncbi:ABC transporter substrate-binding protein [bacterium]|nr:ABC transporter substrate-binding protein [bacterium]